MIGAVAVAFPYCSRTHCGSWISPAPLDLRSGVEVVAGDGCLEARLLPVPRYNIGLVDGKPGDLADLRPSAVLPAAVFREAPHGTGPDLADLEWGSVLSDTDLRGADWRSVDLRGVTLRNVDLRGANLQGADLRGATLENTNLADADLAGANLAGADLGGARLFLVHSTRFYGYISHYANLRGARYNRGTRWPVGLDPRAARAVLDE